MTTETVERALDTAEMLRYFAERPEGEVVGYAADAGSCPVACLLREKLGIDPSVDGSTVAWREGEGPYDRHEIPTPPGARDVIYLVDEHFEGRPITAWEAFDIVAHVRRALADEEGR